MKKKIVFLAFLLALVSCGDDNKQTPTPGQYRFSANLVIPLENQLEVTVDSYANETRNTQFSSASLKGNTLMRQTILNATGNVDDKSFNCGVKQRANYHLGMSLMGPMPLMASQANPFVNIISTEFSDSNSRDCFGAERVEVELGIVYGLTSLAIDMVNNKAVLSEVNLDREVSIGKLSSVDSRLFRLRVTRVFRGLRNQEPYYRMIVQSDNDDINQRLNCEMLINPRVRPQIALEKAACLYSTQDEGVEDSKINFNARIDLDVNPQVGL